MRTLVISDLHLGSRLGRDVLRRPSARDALLDALDGVDRLVLLGDVVELLERRAAIAMAEAEPVLRAIGRRLPGDREIVLVPGNHDGALVRPWLRAHGVPDALDARVPLDATLRLRQLTGWLGPDRVTVRYPGVWLSPRVWATHGHYLDRHLMPESAYGITRGLLRRRPRGRVTPRDYERRRAARPEGLTRWLPRSPARLADNLADLLRARTMPGSDSTPVGHRLAPLSARLLGVQMRRASLPALARVAQRLGVDADWVVFGHVHRLGPLPGDDPQQWAAPGGRPRLANTGSWVAEPLLVHGVTPPHPYWPGGAIVLDDDGDPRAVALLGGRARRRL